MSDVLDKMLQCKSPERIYCGNGVTVADAIAHVQRLEEEWHIASGKASALESWVKVFGTTQLSHAKARLDAAEDGRRRAEWRIEELEAKLHAPDYDPPPGVEGDDALEWLDKVIDEDWRRLHRRIEELETHIRESDIATDNGFAKLWRMIERLKAAVRRKHDRMWELEGIVGNAECFVLNILYQRMPEKRVDSLNRKVMRTGALDKMIEVMRRVLVKAEAERDRRIEPERVRKVVSDVLKSKDRGESFGPCMLFSIEVITALGLDRWDGDEKTGSPK